MSGQKIADVIKGTVHRYPLLTGLLAAVGLLTLMVILAGGAGCLIGCTRKLPVGYKYLTAPIVVHDTVSVDTCGHHHGGRR